MHDLLHIAVVGHTNVGKTSLLRTLTRRVNFGEVSDRPGTTRHVEAVDFKVQIEGARSESVVRFYDTPGLEDAVALLAHVSQLPGNTRIERIRAFLAGPEAHGVFEQEAKVLHQMLAAHAAFLVIDTREPVLPKYRDEVELLNACARPILPVLNFVRNAETREAQWRSMLSECGLHACVRFDAAAPFTGSEQALFQDLGTLLPERRLQLQQVNRHLAEEAHARRQSACYLLATQLVEAAALRRTVAVAQWQDPVQKKREVEALRQTLHAHAQEGVDALLALHGFRKGDAAEAPLPTLQGRESADLFDPEALRMAALRLGQGAAVGAAVGAAADVAVGGLSLGAGTALGSVIGGALAQGLGPLGRRLRHALDGQREICAEDPVLYLIADWQLRLMLALEQRGHGAVTRTEGDDLALPPPAVKELARALKRAQPARSHPSWAMQKGLTAHTHAAGPSDREACIQLVRQHLELAAQACVPQDHLYSP